MAEEELGTFHIPPLSAPLTESEGSRDHVALALPADRRHALAGPRGPGELHAPAFAFQSKHLRARGQAGNRGGPVPSHGPGRTGG